MTRIPAWQRAVHVVSETLAIAIVVPLLLQAAKDARPPHRTRLERLAIATLVVDGLLLVRWLSSPR